MISHPIYRINIIIFSITLLWLSLQATIFNGFDGTGRLVAVFSTLQILIIVLKNPDFYSQIKKQGCGLSLISIWFVYAIFNSVLQYTPSDISVITFIFHYLVFPYSVMILFATFDEYWFVKLLKWTAGSLYLYLVCLIFFNFKFEGRIYLGTIDPNELSLILFSLISILGLLYLKNIHSLTRTIVIMIPLFVLSIAIGSRMGFVGSMLLMGGLIFVSGRSFISLKKIILVVPLAVPLLIFVTTQTMVGERLLDTTSNSEALEYNPSRGTIFEHYGDRGLYYILGWEAFKSSPAFGIGLENFKHKYYYTVLHSEVMVQLGELGSVGFLLYFSFMLILLLKLIRLKRNKENNYLLYIYGVLVFSSTTLFLYKSFAVFLLYGILMYSIKENESGR